MSNFQYNIYDNYDFEHEVLDSFVYRLLLDIITTTPTPSEIQNCFVSHEYASIDPVNTKSQNNPGADINLFITYRMRDFSEDTIKQTNIKRGTPSYSIVYEIGFRQISNGQNNNDRSYDIKKAMELIRKSITQNNSHYETTINNEVYASNLTAPSNYQVANELDGMIIEDINNTGNLRSVISLLITIYKK